MGSTYLSLHYHIIFSTKNRERIITADYRPKLYEYICGTLRGLEAKPLSLGGVEDHIHLLVALTSRHCLANFVRDLKRFSSKWARDTLHPSFGWQEGYAAITISPSSLSGVCRYIENQEEHHRQRSFREELILLLREAGIPYDAKYLD